MLFWSQSQMLGPSKEPRISSIEEQHNIFGTMPGVAALWIPIGSRNWSRDLKKGKQKLTNYSSSFRGWNTQFQTCTWQGKGRVSQRIKHAQCSSLDKNRSFGYEVILEVGFNNVQTDYVHLNKPFWVSSTLLLVQFLLVWRKLKSHVQSAVSLPHRTAFGITTRRKTELQLKLC